LRKEKLVTVATFTDVIEAKIVQSMLESEGISCFMQDENIIGINWMYSAAVGGVKLKVKESDRDEASMLLSGNVRFEEVPDFGSHDRTKERDDTVRCPVCGSDDVVKEQVSKRAFFLTWIFLGFPLPFFKKAYRCLICRRTWKKEDIKG
jgi:DNA-directed RNA polymerase subunit RPC12/RpoP